MDRNDFNSSNFHFIQGTRAVEAQFQIEAPDPYLLLKRRTDLGMQVVLSTINFITYLYYLMFQHHMSGLAWTSSSYMHHFKTAELAKLRKHN